MTIRVLVVDDQPLAAAGISFLLQAAPDVQVVAHAATADAAAAAAEHLPHVVVADVPADGIHLIGTLAAGGVARVVLLISQYTVPLVRDALLAGAAGCMLKDSAPDALLGVVRAGTRTGTWLDPAIVGDMLRQLTSLPTAGAGVTDGLTPREREVLVLMAHGLSNAEIAGRLYISALTARTHVGRVIMKLGARNRAHAVTTAYRAGIVRISPRPSDTADVPPLQQNNHPALAT